MPKQNPEKMHDEAGVLPLQEQNLTEEQGTLLRENRAEQTENQPIFAVQQKFYSGPLPSAAELIKYNSAVPDAADRIIKMAENQQKMREKELTAGIERDKRGFWAGLYAVTLIAGLAFYAMMKSNYWIAGVLIAMISFAYCFFPVAYSRALKKETGKK